MSDTAPILQAETAIMFVQHSITIPLTCGMQVGLQFATVVYTQFRDALSWLFKIMSTEFQLQLPHQLIINVSTTVL